MEFHSPEMQRIHDARASDGGRAAVELADALFRKALDTGDVDLLKEARQWITQALSIDKAAADAEIAKLKADYEAKMARGEAGRRIAQRRASAGNVVALRKGGG